MARRRLSANPDKHVELADADAGARVLLRPIENFRPQAAAEAARS
jgi:allantoate deiminase